MPETFPVFIGINGNDSQCCYCALACAAIFPVSLKDFTHALADATRRGILARLGSGEMTVKELAEPFAMSAPAITKHLKV